MHSTTSLLHLTKFSRRKLCCSAQAKSVRLAICAALVGERQVLRHLLLNLDILLGTPLFFNTGVRCFIASL